jgi:hypothetical protein
VPQPIAALVDSASVLRQKTLSRVVSQSRNEAVVESLIEAAKARLVANSHKWSRVAWSAPEHAASADNQLIAARIRLGLDLGFPEKCICGAPADHTHVLSCPKLGVFHHRHSMTVQTIGQMLRDANFVVRYEPMLSDFVPNTGQLRPDILARRGTQAYALDVTHSAGSADAAEEMKRSKYSSFCNAMGVPFHPVAFSLAGGCRFAVVGVS